MKRPLLALFLSIVLLVPAQGARAANFVEPMVAAWQMMDAMRQMMEWFVGGGNNSYRNQLGNGGWMPFGSIYSTPNSNNLNSLNLLGLNRYPVRSNLDGPYLNRRGRYPATSGTVVAVPLEGDGEWLRDPIPYEENFWGDDPYWDGSVVPLGEGYPASRSGYEGIDGLWLVKTGERWKIQGNQFVLRKANGAISQGELTIKGDWIEVRHYQSNQTISLQFRQMDDLLVIRDRSGTVVLLHRQPEFQAPFNYGGYYQ
ncbi:MAG: hypothetical protein OQK78_04805 [Gammaproteobacteria bacterium]|nr:hypothetical protein [Gammaproteobacteria bacterium]